MVTPLQILNAIRGITTAISDSVVALNEIRAELKALGSLRIERHEIGTFDDCPRVAVIVSNGDIVKDVTFPRGKWRIVAEKVD